jgi:hypothetical protein
MLNSYDATTGASEITQGAGLAVNDRLRLDGGHMLHADHSGYRSSHRGVWRLLAFPAVIGPLVRSLGLARLVRDQNCPVE